MTVRSNSVEVFIILRFIIKRYSSRNKNVIILALKESEQVSEDGKRFDAVESDDDFMENTKKFNGKKIQNQIKHQMYITNSNLYFANRIQQHKKGRRNKSNGLNAHSEYLNEFGKNILSCFMKKKIVIVRHKHLLTHCRIQFHIDQMNTIQKSKFVTKPILDDFNVHMKESY